MSSLLSAAPVMEVGKCMASSYVQVDPRWPLLFPAGTPLQLHLRNVSPQIGFVFVLEQV